MCISDNSCSISTDQGDFHSIALSESVFTSLSQYPWTPPGDPGTVSCSIYSLPESVQTKDRENSCVDFLQVFISSGSNSSHNLPTTHIFTDDGHDFTVTPTQELLQWQGGWTTQNGWLEASQFGIGYKLVSWANDIYQYVQITSMSFDANDSIGINWLTTKTNSYQLQNGIVVRGFVDDFCACAPSASIYNIPCGSTASFCYSSSAYHPLIFQLSGSESGMGDDGGGGVTVKSWTASPTSNAGAVAYSLSGTTSNQLTASITAVTSSGQIDLCYKETRYLGPIVMSPFQFSTGSLTIASTASCASQSTNTPYLYSGSAGAYDVFSSQGTVFAWNNHTVQNTAGGSSNAFITFVLCDGSDADLPATLNHSGRTQKDYGSTIAHFFCSNSADYGTLTDSHPSFSNSAYSLAWKINSASLHGGMHNTQWGISNSLPWDPSNFKTGNHQFPSASYAYQPVNITKDASTFVGFTSDYSSIYEGNTIHIIAIDTGSWCPAASHPTTYEICPVTIDQSTGLSYWWLAGALVDPYISHQSACAYTSSYGLEASDTCCTQIRLSRKPAANFPNPSCQTNYGAVVKLTAQFPFLNTDNISWSISGNDQGYFSAYRNGTPTVLVVDPTTHVKGKIRLCYTASSDNPKCTNNADEIFSENVIFTPNCCPTMSGCVDLYFNPGATAGQNNTYCWPTMSLEGFQPIYTFTDTDVSEPTWSIATTNLQYEDYQFNGLSTPGESGASPFVDPGTPDYDGKYGYNSNQTNSYSTEIYMNGNVTDDLNFGYVTMQLQVSNGPCTFTSTVENYIARTYTNAGPDRMYCAKDASGEYQGPVGPAGLIQLQATGSGTWQLITPSIPSNGHPTIIDASSPTSEIRVAICGELVTVQWNEISSSLVTLGGEVHSAICPGTDQVRVRKFGNSPPFKIFGHSKKITPSTIYITSSISSSRPPDPTKQEGPFGDATGTAISDSFGRSYRDHLHELHVFGLPPFTTSIHYETPNNAVRDEISFQLHRPTDTPFPMVLPSFDLPATPQTPGIMFKWKGTTGNLHGIRLANSESNNGVMSQSKEYIPLGIFNPSINGFPYETSSKFYFSASSADGYAQASGSSLTTPYDTHFYSFGISGSTGDCECSPRGTQGKIFYHIEPVDFRFATQSGIVGLVGSPLAANNMGTILETAYSNYLVEPNLGVSLPSYNSILALNLMSGSVVKSYTGSSVIYHHDNILNMPAPYLTASNPIRPGIPTLTPATNGVYAAGALVGDLPRSWPPRRATLSSGDINYWYPYNRQLAISLDAHADLVTNFTPATELISEYPRRSGINYAGHGVNFKWKARELYCYGKQGIAHALSGVTGSFGDTMTSESFVEAPIFFPGLRAHSQSALSNPYVGFETSKIRGENYSDGFESGGDGKHVPIPVNNITTQSVMFEVTASVSTAEGVKLKNYYASMSVMFLRG